MIKSRSVSWLAAILLASAVVTAAQSRTPAPKWNALVFSKTLGYRHASITNGIAAIKQLGVENRFHVDATEDSTCFTPSNLAKYRVVIFLSTIGDILTDEQHAALQSFVERGGGLAAIHAAAAGVLATEGKWPWYVDALCAQFTNHSAIVQATVNVEDRKDPSTAGLPEHWVRTDEWYNFSSSPRGKARVLASLDETTYKGGNMGKDHPIAWCKPVGKGRVWFTALGHTEASFTEPLFLRHLLGGIQAAAGTKRARFTPE
jgi:type 1 glutamine amidotransferase